MRRVRSLTAGVLAVGLLAALPVPSTGVAPLDDALASVPAVPALGDRIVPEPLARTTYVGFDEALAFLDALAAAHPRFVHLDQVGLSEEGRPLVTVEVTDAESPVPHDDRGVVYVSQGIHANEPGGREGMLRVVEDLARAAEAGDTETLATLADLRLVQSVVNVDTWATGELTALVDGRLPSFGRENIDGIDLNRELPWPGHVGAARDFRRTAEGRAMVADADARREAGERVVGTADVHGMIQDESAVWTLFSSGQFDLGGWVRQLAQADAIDARVRDALPAIETLRELTGATTGELVTAHRATTSSEFKGGLSGSGFYGDFLAQPEGLDSPSVSTIELFFNNGPAGTYNQATYVAPVVQAHVDSVRAIVAGLVEVARVEHQVRLEGTSAVGVVHDPRTVAVPATEDRRTADDEVTPARFFDDLDPYLEAPARRLAADGLSDASLAGLDTLIVPTADELLDAPTSLAAVRRFVTGGGRLVLTDDAVRVLPALDDRLTTEDVTEARTPIGNASFVAPDHPLATGVRTGPFAPALHTYEPSTLGYDTESSGGRAPVWRVDREAFEAAGGTTVATTTGATSIGELPLGAGSVRLLGGLLPLPVLTEQVRFGLANYAPTDTGYLVLANALDATLTVREVPAAFGPSDGDDDAVDPGDGAAPRPAPGRPPHAGRPDAPGSRPDAPGPRPDAPGRPEPRSGPGRG